MDNKIKSINANLPLNSITQNEALLLVSELALQDVEANYEYVNEAMGIWEDGETDIPPFAVEFCINSGKKGVDAFENQLKERGINYDRDTLRDLNDWEDRESAEENGVGDSYWWREGKHYIVIALRLEGPFDPEKTDYEE